MYLWWCGIIWRGCVNGQWLLPLFLLFSIGAVTSTGEVKHLFLNFLSMLEDLFFLAAESLAMRDAIGHRPRSPSSVLRPLNWDDCESFQDLDFFFFTGHRKSTYRYTLFFCEGGIALVRRSFPLSLFRDSLTSEVVPVHTFNLQLFILSVSIVYRRRKGGSLASSLHNHLRLFSTSLY